MQSEPTNVGVQVQFKSFCDLQSRAVELKPSRTVDSHPATAIKM